MTDSPAANAAAVVRGPRLAADLPRARPAARGLAGALVAAGDVGAGGVPAAGRRGGEALVAVGAAPVRAVLARRRAVAAGVRARQVGAVPVAGAAELVLGALVDVFGAGLAGPAVLALRRRVWRELRPEQLEPFKLV
jgi:hypothetical protein